MGRSGKSAKLYRLERDALQEKLDEALHHIAKLTSASEAIQVVRIDISNWKQYHAIDYLLQSEQFGGGSLAGDTAYIDVIGIRSPDTENTLRWLDSWKKQPIILRRTNDHNRI